MKLKNVENINSLKNKKSMCQHKLKKKYFPKQKIKT